MFTDKRAISCYVFKENNSNGCVNTVDLTYSFCSFFLVYMPNLLKAIDDEYLRI
ncbi:DUF4965 domain-containing protein [Bacteroides faecis]|nr:DUF4965 domain-containing protein [Bacteroides faecis]